MSRAANVGRLLAVTATALLAIGCGPRSAPVATAEPSAESVNVEPQASTPADLPDAGSRTALTALTDAELDDLERTLDEMDATLDELELDVERD